MNSILKMILSFVVYQPSPVIIMNNLCLRGVVTASTGKSTYVLVFEKDGLVYTLDKPTNLIVNIKKDRIELNCVNMIDESLSNLLNGAGKFEILKSEDLDYFRQLRPHRYDQSMSLHSDNIQDENAILLKAEVDMNLQEVILESPTIALFAKRYTFNNCSFNTHKTIIGSLDKNSLYDSIEFIFDEQVKTNSKIFGAIDFEADSADFCVFSLRAIKINFSEHAFSSQGGPILEIKPGEKLF